MKILVIRFMAIGDIVLTSVLCNSLKKSFPNSQVDYLVHKVSACLYEQHPYIDNVIGLTKKQRKNPLKYFKVAYKLARHDYDIIIDASSTGKSELISLLAQQAAFRIGRQKKRRGYNYTHKITLNQLLGDKIDQRLRLLDPLKEAGYDIVYDDQMTLIVTESQKQQMHQQLLACGIDLSRPIFVFSVSSKEEQKKWNLSQQVMVAEHCLAHYNAQIVLYAGAEHEKVDIKKFHKEMQWHPDIYSEVLTDSLVELAALFSHCDFFFGNEGGPRHIAQALQVPSVAVFSPSANKAEWLPGQSDRYQGIDFHDVESNSTMSKIKFGYGDTQYYKLYNSIKAEAVIPLVDSVLDKHLNQSRLSQDKVS